MDLPGHVATVDALRARPFPAREERSGAVESGPGYHIADLRIGEDFWDADGDPADRRQAEDDMEAECQALVEVFTERWGVPETVDLAAHLERLVDGEPVPRPLRTLCNYAHEAWAWRVDGRWIGVCVGQRDRELPLQLVAAVADAASVP
ncbi:hypothetical protein ABZZ36_28525 [Actinacidiphila glaucinigra]|uniref:hypothetical protein n=1 Tax=Actinacidiphila glaucinigra TaxID=235986 RepID=UPI0033B3A327